MYTKTKNYQILQANKLQLNLLLNYYCLHTILYGEIQRIKIKNVYKWLKKIRNILKIEPYYIENTNMNVWYKIKLLVFKIK